MQNKLLNPLKSTLMALAICLTGFSHADEKFPSRQVTLVVPQAAGGANDAIARVVAQKLSEQWGQSVIVENRPGAGGNVGTAYTAKAKNDGYTLLVNADSAQVINPFFQFIYPTSIPRPNFRSNVKVSLKSFLFSNFSGFYIKTTVIDKDDGIRLKNFYLFTKGFE